MSATAERVWYSPAVRTLIRELGIDPQTVTGTGRGGRVTRDDMLCAGRDTVGAVREPPSPVSEDLIPLTRVRRMTAENLTRTIRAVPMERAYLPVDWGTLAAHRATIRAAFAAEHGVPLTFMPFILRGMVLAARRAPRVNSRWTERGPEIVSALTIGVAVSTDAGLLVPVVPHAEDWSLVGMAKVLHRVVIAAREGRLTVADITGGTITVTNPGPFGTVLSMPIIPPGQSAIVSVDSVREIPSVRDGALGIRQIANVGLTYDARLCNDSDALTFLTTLQRYLEGGFLIE